MTRLLLLRADGNARIGLGHVMRLLALARLLSSPTGNDGETWFCARQPGPALTARLQAAGLRVVLIPEELPLAAEPAWLRAQLPAVAAPLPVLVLDGYAFTADYQQQLSALGFPLVNLDDFQQQYQWADVVLNPAGGLTSAAYRAAPATTFGLGPTWAPLQPEFQALASAPADSLTDSPRPSRWFLNMGGADPANHTLRLVQEFRARFPTVPLAVVTGAAYSHDRAVLQAAGGPATTTYHDLAAPALAALLTTCQGFICPPSGMAYECAAAGGLLVVVPTADNQRGMYDYLTSYHLALTLADFRALAAAAWSATAAALAARQRAVFDGQTGPRLQEVVADLRRAYALGIRRATPADSAQLLAWANDPTVRANALTSDPITPTGHEAWFARRLTDPNAYLYLLTAPDAPGTLLGQVRIEFDAGTPAIGTIDYSLAPAWRGQGWGAPLLRRATRQLRLERPGAWRLLGVVRETNPASGRVFQKLGFTIGEPQFIGGHRCRAYFADAPAPTGPAPASPAPAE